MSADPYCEPGGGCPVCNDPDDADPAEDLEEKVRQLTQAAADCAQATTTALDRLILAEAVCKAAEGFLDLRGNPDLERAVEAWRKGRPS